MTLPNKRPGLILDTPIPNTTTSPGSSFKDWLALLASTDRRRVRRPSLARTSSSPPATATRSPRSPACTAAASANPAPHTPLPIFSPPSSFLLVSNSTPCPEPPVILCSPAYLVPVQAVPHIIAVLLPDIAAVLVRHRWVSAGRVATGA
eukprot:3215797-Rhodomonas_salina.2